jgi:ABC-type dipeptide/oligopeptide/nickel transport system permease subunit
MTDLDPALSVRTAGTIPGEAGIADVKAGSSLRADVWRRFRKNKLAMLGLAFVVLLVLVAIFAPLITSYTYTETSRSYRAAPSSDHWFGTDLIGRDVYTRVVYGARVSLKIGFSATALSLIIGVLFGAIAGFFGTIMDGALMRLTDVFLAIPYIILAIAIATIFGRSENSIILVLAFIGWMPISRIVRASFLGLKKLEYVEAATALGYSKKRIMFGHVLPNAMQPIIVYGTVAIGGVILSEAALSFIGVGPQSPTPAWGLMVSEAGSGSLTAGAHMLFFPGLAIFLTVLAFVFIGDGLRDALDPKLK